MIPLLYPGDLILVDLYAYRNRSPEPGEIVVAWHPRQPVKVTKRVQTVYPNGTLDLIGDNPAESTDFKAIPEEKILGKVTSKLL